MMSVRVRDVSIPVSKVDLRPDPAGITRVSNLDPTTVTWRGAYAVDPLSIMDQDVERRNVSALILSTVLSIECTFYVADHSLRVSRVYCGNRHEP